MSDSFADLWNSSTPQKKPQTLSSLAQQQQQQSTQPLRSQGPDLFALLSSTSSSSGAARSSPSLRSNTHSATSTPPPAQSQHRQQLRPQPPKSTSDAFSDLFSSSSSSSNQNLTIAQRSALAEKQRKDVAASTHQKQRETEQSAWAGLDSLGRDNTTTSGGFTGLTPANASRATSNSTQPKADDDDWGLGDFGKSSASSQDKHKPDIHSTTTTQDTDDWNLDSFESSQTQASKSTAKPDNTATKPGASLWDLDEFSSPVESKPTRRADSPSNEFDFGGREDGLLGESQENDDGNDDFMSVFNRPPKPKPTPPSNQQPPTSPSSSSPAPAPVKPREGSPPPHILGQVVEMGFSIPKARAALLANNNDVQAALDQLLASEGGYTGGSGGRGTPTSIPASRNAGSPALSQQQNVIPRRRDRELRERDQQPRRGDTSSPTSSMGGGAASADIQAQAEQLLAQASELGRGMFTKASAFWKEKKDQVQKAVEEHRSSSAASGNERAGSGRPKWMQQDGNGDDYEPPMKSSVRVNKGAGVFTDDVGASSTSRKKQEREREPETWVPKRPDRQRERERQRAREREEAAAAATPPPPPPEEPEVDLFAPAPVTASNQSHLFDSFQASSSSSTPPLPKPRKQQPQSRTQQQPKFQRNITTVSSQVASLKSEANATFKLGQFGNAEAIYTRAIESLGKTSSNNLYLILLLNNRANARMKNGDVNGAAKDCKAVVGLITDNRLELSSSSDDFDSLGGGGGGEKSSSTPSSGNDGNINWDPSQDVDDGKLRIPISPGGETAEETVDLAEGLVKAIKRRAEAYEGMEKWNKAKRDWEWLRSVGWVRESVRGEAGRGVGRCMRMVDGGAAASGDSSGLNGSTSSKPPSSTTKPKARPTPRPPPTSNKPSEALQALRVSTNQAEAEDQAKHELKDTIDAKLSAWKSGKESNIRALLASLDLVLWEELLNSGNAVKVGMHELVTPAQVKVKYMKAVAKVHPDKLNANNSTLEQRMIAQGVFGALNEAWNAFKQ